MSFFRSILNTPSNSINTRVVQELGEKIQAEFNGKAQKVAHGKTYTREEISELSRVIDSMNMNLEPYLAANEMRKPKDLSKQIFATNLMFTDLSKRLNNVLATDPMVRANARAEFKAKFQVLDKLEPFVNKNSKLISAVRTLSIDHARDFEKAIEALKKQSGIQVVEATLKLLELDSNEVDTSYSIN
jgi:hypothetical protein